MNTGCTTSSNKPDGEINLKVVEAVALKASRSRGAAGKVARARAQCHFWLRACREVYTMRKRWKALGVLVILAVLDAGGADHLGGSGWRRALEGRSGSSPSQA